MINREHDFDGEMRDAFEEAYQQARAETPNLTRSDFIRLVFDEHFAHDAKEFGMTKIELLQLMKRHEP